MGKSVVETARVAQIACVKCQKVLDVSHLPSFSEIKCPECGTPQTVPALFGGFLLLEQLGTGGMGVIYRAKDKELGRLIALKVMKRSLGENLEFIKSFKHEAQAAASLNHRNVVQIYQFGQFEGQPFIAMELMTGGQLDDMIAGRVQLDETQALQIHLDVTEGLKAASDIGLLHGDIKPANVLFGQEGEAKVVDFGLASYVGQQKQQDARVWGTPYYIAPEKARGKKVDFRSDIYSLGATLFHVLAGQPPFDGPTPTDVVLARLNQPAPSLADFRDDLHPATIAMVARMLEADPIMRYPSYPALLVDMREALAESEEPSRQSGGASAIISAVMANRPALRINGKFLAAITAVVLAGAIIWGVGTHRKQQARLAAEQTERQNLKLAVAGGLAAWEQINTQFQTTMETAAAFPSLTAKSQKLLEETLETAPAADRVNYEADKLDQVVADAEDLLCAMALTRDRLEAATNSVAAKPPAEALEASVSAMTGLHQTLADAQAAAKQALEEAARIQTAVADRKSEADRQRKLAEKQQQEEEQSRQLQMREAQAAALRLRQTTQRELDLVDETRAANIPLITQKKFEEATRELAKVPANLTLNETRDYVKNIIEAYVAMAKLKLFVVTSIRGAPCVGGWIVGETARDVVQADPAAGLTVALGTAGTMKVTWEQVSVLQFLKIANYYIERMPDESERAELLLAAALFCYENGSFKTAENFAILACKLNAALASEVNRLMPGFATEPTQ